MCLTNVILVSNLITYSGRKMLYSRLSIVIVRNLLASHGLSHIGLRIFGSVSAATG